MRTIPDSTSQFISLSAEDERCCRSCEQKYQEDHIENDYADLIIVIIYFERIFLITIFQEKAKNKHTIWESKTTFINDFNDQNKQISPYIINFHLRKSESFLQRLSKTNYFETWMQVGTSIVTQF